MFGEKYLNVAEKSESLDLVRYGCMQEIIEFDAIFASDCNCFVVPDTVF